MGCTIRRTDGFTESDIPFSDGRCGVSETPDSAGEPGAGNWHAGFGEQRVETWFMVELRTHPHNRKGGNRHSLHLPMRAPLSDSTCAVERRHFLAGANPVRQLSLQPVAVGAAHKGNDMG